MPNYKTHLVGGAASFGLLLYCMKSYNPSFLTALEWFFFALMGSLFPDIDTKSKGQKLFYRVLIVILIILLMQNRFRTIAMISIASFIPLLVNHRGIFHSAWFIIMLGCFCVVFATIFLPSYVSIIMIDTLFFVGGAFSHLILDRGIKRVFGFT